MKQYILGGIAIIGISYFSYSFFQTKNIDLKNLSTFKKEKVQKFKKRKIINKRSSVFIRPPSVQATDNHFERKKISYKKKIKKSPPKSSSRVQKSLSVSKGRAIEIQKEAEKISNIIKAQKKMLRKKRVKKRTPSSVASTPKSNIVPGGPSLAPVQEVNLYWYNKILKDPSLKSVTDFLSAYKTRQIEDIDFKQLVSQLIIHPSYFVRKAALMITSQIVNSDSFVYLTQIKHTDQSLEKEVNFHLQKYLDINNLDYLKIAFEKNNDYVILKEIATYVVLSAKNNLELKDSDQIIFSDTYSPFVGLIEKEKNISTNNEQKVFYEKTLGELNKLLSY